MTTASGKLMELGWISCAMDVATNIPNHVIIENHIRLKAVGIPGAILEAGKYLNGFRLHSQIEVFEEDIDRIRGLDSLRCKWANEPAPVKSHCPLSIGVWLSGGEGKVTDVDATRRQIHQPNPEEFPFHPVESGGDVDRFLGVLNGLLKPQEPDSDPRLTHRRPRNRSSQDGQYYVRQVRPVHARSLA